MITNEVSNNLLGALGSIHYCAKEALIDTDEDRSADKAAEALQVYFEGWQRAVSALHPNQSIESAVTRLCSTGEVEHSRKKLLYQETKTLLARLAYLHGPQAST